MARPVKRPYDATHRRALTKATRQQILDEARSLFVEQGYASTSMRQLADVAGVSVQTIYNSFGSKFGVFSALMDVIVAGDDEPVRLADREEFRELASLDDPVVLIEHIVRLATSVLDRLAVIYPTLRSAASVDPQVAEAHERFTFEGRHQDYRVFGKHLAASGRLRPQISARRATDILWTILSPDVFELLVTHRGWSTQQFEAWAAETLTASLLAP